MSMDETANPLADNATEVEDKTRGLKEGELDGRAGVMADDTLTPRVEGEITYGDDERVVAVAGGNRTEQFEWCLCCTHGEPPRPATPRPAPRRAAPAAAAISRADPTPALPGRYDVMEEEWIPFGEDSKQFKDKDAFILDEIDDIFNALDESLATVNTILGSRFVKPLRMEAEIWKKNLLTLNQIVEEWIITQKQWIYLENIFTAPDIKRQLPMES